MKFIRPTITTALLATITITAAAQSPPADALINKLVEKGILSEKEAKDLMNEATTTNALPASKWRISDAIKNVTLFGDLRFRYEYRGVDNPAVGGLSPNNTYYRERFRYALRAGIRGDLYDNFYYGVRLETSTNPRSPWVTFADDSNPTPADKHSDGINVGQAFVGWRPTDWYEMTVGRMPMPLYITPLIWDSDINPEGAVEKFKFSPTEHLDLFANFGQFIYQDTNPDTALPSSDTFMLAWQVGANVKLTKDISAKVAPVIYNYTGRGSGNQVNATFVGQGLGGLNYSATGGSLVPTNTANALRLNENGINDLLVLEVPGEVNFKVGKYNARVFGDFAYNFQGNDRARAAAAAAGPAILPRAYTGEDKAYQVGAGFGNLGLVYGMTSKKHTWEARAYWQHIEQYAVDVNLIDSDFFEGRANLEGVYTAFAYSFTDAIIGTVRYGYANRINQELGTGGNNLDIPLINPIRNYHLLQLDVTWRF